MYSLTKATKELLDNYFLGSKSVSENVIKYNTHKIRHSNGVLEVGRNLLIKIKEKQNLSEKLINQAEIVFLLHDIARFYQNDKVNILKNNDFEHGDEAYKILKKLGYDEQICLAVKYHNKYKLTPIYQEENFIKMDKQNQDETIFLAKIIRDADKIQNMIYDIFNINGLINLNSRLIPGDISKEVLDDIKNKFTANRDNIKTYADDIVGNLSRVYDINFSESIDMLNYYSYFEKIINEISKLDGVKKESIQIIKENILNYTK